MHHYKDQALVLYKTPHKDAHEWVTLFTRSRGKVRALAFGTKSIKSKYRGILETLTHCEVALHDKDSYASIQDGKAIWGYHGVTQDLDRSVQAFRILELLHRMMQEEDPYEQIFDRVLLVLRAIEVGEKPLLHSVAFMAFLLTELGVLPHFQSCTSCGHSMKEQSGNLSLDEFSFHCVPCGGEMRGVDVSFDQIKLLHFFQHQEFAQLRRLQEHGPLLQSLEEMLMNVIRYHLNRDLQTEKLVGVN